MQHPILDAPPQPPQRFDAQPQPERPKPPQPQERLEEHPQELLQQFNDPKSRDKSPHEHELQPHFEQQLLHI